MESNKTVWSLLVSKAWLNEMPATTSEIIDPFVNPEKSAVPLAPTTEAPPGT
jgi:hypothetical protein